MMYLLSKNVFHKILYNKIDVHETQQEMLTLKLDEMKNVLKKLKDRKNFAISKSLKDEFESEVCQEDWRKLVENIENQELSPKDMVVLNLYFTFMGVEL
jgi:hypothetical protein